MQESLNDARAELAQLVSIVSLRQPLPAIPPKELQVRVVGAFCSDFFDSGKLIFQQIDNLLRDHGQAIHEMGNILDFGCGCGRVMIPMSHLLADPRRISGTDIDEEAIRWFRANYSCFSDLDVNGSMPQTKYPDAAFDFIYSISIFTHLPEDMQYAWLKELCRILKPGGYGMFTTHGENHFQSLGESARGELMAKGFYYSVGHGTRGLPEFYQTSYHTHEYIQREWERYFEVVAIRKQWISNWQDAVLVRKRTGSCAGV